MTITKEIVTRTLTGRTML